MHFRVYEFSGIWDPTINKVNAKSTLEAWKNTIFVLHKRLHGEKIPEKVNVLVPIMRVQRTFRKKFLD